ncbi:hypothetical protein RCF98_03210 [Thiothrix lacustris]|jgi:hypothetical protein|uniref:Uncharacterized protein n=1 Tax=Thiothrix lacustris TaxID=525917 RepID=A0ABY9MS73_9GAMM|nr:hypothetical protein [Thiothrix lacustris]WML91368.1 hypothetical protein RCF98_03210 [Thiothrix lacustris]
MSPPLEETKLFLRIMGKGFDRDDFISLLAYMGFTTLYRKTG